MGGSESCLAYMFAASTFHENIPEIYVSKYTSPARCRENNDIANNTRMVRMVFHVVVASIAIHEHFRQEFWDVTSILNPLYHCQCLKSICATRGVRVVPNISS